MPTNYKSRQKDNNINEYFKRIKEEPLLDREREEELAKKIEYHQLRLLYTFSRFDSRLENMRVREWIKEECPKSVEDIIEYEENFSLPQTVQAVREYIMDKEENNSYRYNVDNLVEGIKRTIAYMK